MEWCDSGSRTAMLHVTEDTPPDMLAGAMDLTVHLPIGRSITMSAERSTPMMDLLVQITTNNQLQLSNYTLQALGMAPSAGHGDKILPYKPNTPIGTLDTQHIRVIAKSRTLPTVKAAPIAGQLPFESTFRLKVHLPRNQLYVTRVSRNVQLEDIMKKVCEEKNLDPVKYELKHPANLDEILDPKLTLCDYQITEIYVVSKGTISLSQAFSTSDIMALRKEEERKQMHNKTGGGVFNLIFRRGKSSMGSGSISSDTRSISPTHSDDSRSVTPPGIQQPIVTPYPKKDILTERPKPPLRKRRPAPKPPQAPEAAGTAAEDPRTTTGDARTTTGNSRRSSDRETIVVSEVSELRRSDNGLVICHSRNSSDSSGYHEASVLSEHCNTSVPRRPRSAFVGTGEGPKMHSQSVTNLSKMAAHSKSTTSLGMTGRKKKAAPPPPPAIRASNPSVHLEASSPVVASQTTPPIEVSLTSHQTLNSLPSSDLISDTSEAKPFGSTDSGIAPEKLEEEEVGKEISCPQDDLDWHYELPSPPRAFRDASPNEEDSKDSVVTSPELFEKLKTLEDEQTQQEDSKDSVVTSSEMFEKLKTLKDEQTLPLNTLSLEKLERRQSMVYQRVLTGLRMTEEVEEEQRDTFSSSLSKFESTLAELQTRFTPKASQQALPNFKISTYDRPKQKIKVFEDDTVRSNSDKPAGVLQRYVVGRSMESISARKNSTGNESTKSDEEFRPTSRPSGPIRSESFSQDNARGPARPVSRSKSHLTLDGAVKYRVDRRGSKNEGMSRSNSLYDVSGLQSLGVMRLIQNKLNIPATSMENLAHQEKIYQPLPRPEPQKEPQQKQSFPSKTTSHIIVKPSVPEKVYKYSGPPAINMSTWSERPKVPVSVARDEDYTLGNHNSSISEPTTIDNRIFFSHTTPAGYHKPQRPHSIASDLDISRVPVVRSVELKKPFRELATHIHAPVVRGFQASAWRKGSFATNSQVPFGQGTLRRIESSKMGEVRPPSGPDSVSDMGSRKTAVSQVKPAADERNQLLSAIRNFGGKKGLRAVKTA